MAGQDELSPDTPTEEGGPPAPPQPPTVDEDMNLVAKLRAGPRQETFYLPEGKHPDGTPRLSETYFIELRSWTGAKRDRYLSAGMSYGMDVPRGKMRHADVQRMSTDMDRVQQFRTMVQLSVIDFRLIHRGQDVACQKPPEANWPVFQDLPPEVTDWVRDTIRQFQGVELEELEGEA